jgi:hypothetical protein
MAEMGINGTVMTTLLKIKLPLALLTRNMKIISFVITFLLFSIQSFSQNQPKKFTKEQLVEDLRYLIYSLESIHPNLYAYQPDFLKLSEIEIQIDDIMTARDFSLLINPYIVALGDGHTKITIY